MRASKLFLTLPLALACTTKSMFMKVACVCPPSPGVVNINMDRNQDVKTLYSLELAICRTGNLDLNLDTHLQERV